jgi:hypothetical protein
MPNDPIIPPEGAVSAWEQITTQIDKASKALEKMRSEGKEGTAEFVEQVNKLEELKLKYAQLSNAMTSQELLSKKLTGAVGDLTSGMGPMGRVIGSVASKIGTDLIGALGKSIHILGAMGSSTYKGLIDPLSQAGVITAGVRNPLRGLDDAITALRKTQDTARTATVMLGDGIKKAGEEASLYPQRLRLAAAATGITTQELDVMNKTMMMVPGAMRQARGGIADITETQKMAIQPTAILATTMRAFGMDARQAAELGKRGWYEFNQTTEDTIRQMGDMAAASRMTGVDRQKATEQIMQASGSLAIFGQKASSASSIWVTFMNSLKSAGVPINQVGDIVNRVTQGIANMSVQHRAFIGMMGGMAQGRTALGGALQLELAMRSPEGMQQNLQSLTTTLGQFAGGRIITLEEAARNPQLEMQFQVQRSMLGKLAGITSQEQQNRVLETLQNVQRGGMSVVEGSRDLEKSFKEGKTLQEQQLSFIRRIEQNTRALLGEGADRQLEALDDASRSLRTIGQEGFGMERVFSRFMGRVGTERGRSILQAPGGRHTFEALGRQFREALPQYMQQAGGVPFGRIGELLQNTIGGFLDRTIIPPETRIREPRRPAGRPQETIVPFNVLEPAHQTRGTIVPAIRRPTRGINRGETTLEQAISTQRRQLTATNTLSTLLTTMGRGEGRKLQLMTDLLTTVKQAISPVRETPTTVLREGEGIAARALTLGTAIEREPETRRDVGREMTLVIKIVGDEEKVKKDVTDTLINRYQKDVLGINYA